LRGFLLLACSLVFATATLAQPTKPVQVGSKRFTESYILGEILKQTIDASGTKAEHQRGLGNTAILYNALATGNIDLYPEYTGTIAREILKLDHVPPLAELNGHLAKLGLTVAVPLGFNNTYALAVRGKDAQAKNLRRISDLKLHPQLRLGLSQEFIGRADGWPGLVAKYGLAFAPPRGIDHGLAYEAIQRGDIDVTDIYSTDAKLDRYGLAVLDDDLGYFPRYDAVLLMRADFATRYPAARAALNPLERRLDEASVRQLNAAAELEGREFGAVASAWRAQQAAAGAAAATGGASPGAVPGASAAGAASAGGASAPVRAGVWQRTFAPDFGRLAAEHLLLVFVALAASCAVGVPLGFVAARRGRVAPWVFGVVGVVQTIPALALLTFLIPLTGRIGAVPALIALTLYALLPIVRNTHAGLEQIPRPMTEAAAALGLRPSVIFWKVELPLALPTLLAGIKTSAVVNVGTATIAAFIGAGGFGERIVTGLAINDQATLMAGAIPVAVLALLVQAGFDLLERRLVPAGLRAGGRR
jgi:osmoprotectant transport system permease protein